VSVAVKKLDGVQTVDVSLEKASADIRLKPGNRITLTQLRDVIKKNGYPTKDAQIEARGRFVDRDGAVVLDLLNGSMLEIADKPTDWGSAIVTVTGVSRAMGKDRERLTLTTSKGVN
jgi:copper chaperone CopZ